MGRGDSSSTSLAPGFRFHPTDEELVWYYLKRKICGKPFRFDAISEIDIYRAEPWDLPGLSKLKTRDREWYFFSGLDKKYGNGSRTNRATLEGYWKTTGKDRPVHHRSQIVGMKKTLVYHRGRAPRGERTNWVMHEYRLVDEQLEKGGITQDAFVLCRIFQKSGTGPKNGEQYGAPFVEEEWEDDDVVGMVPGEFSAEEIFVGDDAFVEQNDPDQNVNLDLPLASTTPVNFNQGQTSDYIEDYKDVTEADQKPMMGMVDNQLQIPDGQQYFDLPVEPDNIVKNEHFVQLNNATDQMSGDGIPGEPYTDAVNNDIFDNELYLEANDLLGPVQSNPSDLDGLEEYFSYFDAEDDIGQYLSFGSPELTGTDSLLSDQPSLPKNLCEGTEHDASAGLEVPNVCGNNIASSSEHVMEVTKPKTDIQYPFLEHATRMLGNIPAPPAFASELPPKEMVARLNAAQSSSSVHVTAGIVRIRNITAGGPEMHWSLYKNGSLNVVLSFNMPQGIPTATSEAIPGLGKVAAAVSRGWFCFFFFWALFLAISVKIGTCICAK